MKLRAVCACWLALLLLGGCATPAVELKHPHLYGTDLAGQPDSWHYLRFKWTWPEERQPDWSLDLLAADMVLSDLIQQRQQSLPLWRFHRRAARDRAGHQFSFIFYSAPDVALELRESAHNHPVTQGLLEQGLLDRVYLTTPDNARDLSATSDPGWPDPVQSTWPMFIMGVSQTWLGLVEIHAGDTKKLDGDLDRARKRYEKANEKINEIWFEYAQHAFFHHTSGIFGYEPIWLRKRVRF
jgi:hypothetical protein